MKLTHDNEVLSTVFQLDKLKRGIGEFDALFIEHPFGYKSIECRQHFDLVPSINRINHSQATITTFTQLQRLSVSQLNTFKMSPCACNSCGCKDNCSSCSCTSCSH